MLRTIACTVSNVHCAACVATIEKKLHTLEGIVKVEVNLVENTATITFNTQKITEKRLLAFFTEIGFPASVQNTPSTLRITKYEEELHTKLLQLKKKTFILSLCAIPVVLLSMGTMHIDTTTITLHRIQLFTAIQIILTVPILLASWSIFVSAFDALKKGTASMHTLIALGTSTAFLYSFVNGIFVFAEDATAYHQLYFEAICVILTLTTLGSYIELRAKWQALQQINTLATLLPQTVFVEREGRFVERATKNIPTNSIISVTQGTRIPLDGILQSDTCIVNESMLTGESIPVEKNKGDKLYAGTLLIEGQARIKTTAEDTQSYVNTLITMIQKSQASKAKIASFADTVSAYFVPCLLVIAGIAFFVWLLYSKDLALATRIFLSTVMIACPCAMGLATPIALALGINKGAEHGIIIKNATALEKTAQTTTVVFDKTGTLTKGTPNVENLLLCDPSHSLTAVAMLLLHITPLTKHPVSSALYTWATNTLKNPVSHTNPTQLAHTYILGKGTLATITFETDSYEILLGSERLLQEYDIPFEKSASQQGMLYKIEKTSHNNTLFAEELVSSFITQQATQASTIIYLCINKQVVAIFSLMDTIREEAQHVVKELTQAGIQTIILSGDKKATVTAVGKILGIQEVYAELLPEQKEEHIKRLQQAGKHVLMVGDGINDALALSAADTGIAMGDGVDITQESSSIILLNNKIELVLKTIQLTKYTLRNIKQNLFWAFIYNIISIPVATGILFLFGGPLLSPAIAGAAMIFSSISVMCNALRLRNIPL